MSELTWWISPETQLTSLGEAIDTIQRETPEGWHGNLLLPTNYGQWPQADPDIRTSLPRDMRVGSPADVPAIRGQVESGGLGFGAWGVPLDQAGAVVAAGFAAAAGYYAANFEPGADFWQPGDDPAAVDAWWGAFWNALPDQAALNGAVAATLIPNDGGFGAFAKSLPNLAAGCNALLLEVYGGPATARQYPTLYPADCMVRAAVTTGAPVAPILARANLGAQLGAFKDNVHVWYL